MEGIWRSWDEMMDLPGQEGPGLDRRASRLAALVSVNLLLAVDGLCTVYVDELLLADC